MRVLDLGTGCGIWAAEFGEENPRATVIGIDVFPQPTVATPSNCRLMNHDAEQDWETWSGDVQFDLIHTRLVPFHVNEVRGVLRRCYEHLAPGGYIEMQESWPPSRTDEPIGNREHASKIIKWTELRAKAALKVGIDHSIAGVLPEILGDVGFIDMHVRDCKWPIGPWMEEPRMKEIGNIHLELLLLAMGGLSTELLAHLGMEEQQVVEFVEEVEKELGVGKIYTLVRVIWARKPA